MAEAFDPYLSWLGIRDPQRPPNHYTLLGVALFEGDLNVLATAGDRQMSHVRRFQAGRNAAHSQRLLNELAAAKICLLNPAKKAAYDAALREQIAAGAVVAMALPPTMNIAPQPAPGTWAAAPLTSDAAAPLVPAPVAIEGGAPPRGFPVSTALIAVLSLVAFVLLALIIKTTWDRGDEGEEPAGPIVASNDNGETPKDNGDKPVDPPPPPDATPKPDPTPPIPTPDPTPPMPTPDPTPPAPDPAPKPDVPPAPTPDPTPTPAPTPPLPPTPPTPPATPPEDPRHPLPATAEVDGAIALIRDLYADNYKAPLAANERKLLPAELYRRARQESNDLVARFALLSEARDQAIEVGEATVFDSAITTLGKEYRVDWPAMATAGLQRVAKKGRDVATQRNLAALAQRLAGRAAKEGHFDDAGPMALAARDLARDVSLRTRDTKEGKRDAEVVREIVALIKDIETRAKAQATVREAEARLKTDPNDAAANLVVGRHYGLQDDWQRGLPYLAKSGDTAIQALVAAEAVAPADAAAQVALADAWYEAVAQAAEPNRPLLAARATYWYRQALAGLTGLARAKVEKRLEELKNKVP